MMYESESKHDVRVRIKVRCTCQNQKVRCNGETTGGPQLYQNLGGVVHMSLQNLNLKHHACTDFDWDGYTG
jgi:hypothetical protein